MINLNRNLGIFAIAIIFASTSNTASAKTFQPKGFIFNDRGEQCWYSQVTDEDSNYFHESLAGTRGIITFDDKKCMSETDLGLDVNKMMINNVISGWYSHSDANFKTRVSELHKGSAYQKRGLCIQSATYPIIGITVDYEIEGNSIVRVHHGPTVAGCTD